MLVTHDMLKKSTPVCIAFNHINCTINGMKVSPQEAHALTLEKLANIARGLGNFSQP